MACTSPEPTWPVRPRADRPAIPTPGSSILIQGSEGIEQLGHFVRPWWAHAPEEPPLITPNSSVHNTLPRLHWLVVGADFLTVHILSLAYDFRDSYVAFCLALGSAGDMYAIALASHCPVPVARPARGPLPSAALQLVLSAHHPAPRCRGHPPVVAPPGRRRGLPLQCVLASGAYTDI